MWLLYKGWLPPKHILSITVLKATDKGDNDTEVQTDSNAVQHIAREENLSIPHQ